MFALALQFALPNVPVLPDEIRMPHVAPPPAAVVARDYPAIQQAPVFAPDRRPDRDASSSPSGNGELVLVGAARSDNSAIALIRGSDGVTRRVRLGDAIEGWRLDAVEGTTATISRSGSSRTLDLVPGTAVPVTVPVSTPDTPAQPVDSDDSP